MRILFFGTPEFAADILEILARDHEVNAVFTRPDAIRGRGSKVVASPVKERALKLGLAVHEPPTLKDEEVQSLIAGYAPDVICVAAYGAILPPEILSIAPGRCINIHASLLSRWRGSAPIERAILAGDEETGVCIMRMEEGLDTGPFCRKVRTPIGNKTATELTSELAIQGGQALLESLDSIVSDNAQWVSQNDDSSTYAKKILKGELFLSPENSSFANARKVQASSQAHPSRCVIGKRAVTILRASRISSDDFDQLPKQGEALLLRKRLILGCADGAIEVLSLKPDGKAVMDGSSFAAGIQGIKKTGAEWEAFS